MSLSFSEYRSLDATALAARVRTGEVQASELLELAIARAQAVNPAINAIVIQHDELAREAAAGALPGGPLRGVPFLLKDLAISLRGTVTSEGSRFFQDARSEADSTLMERYRAAGLVVFGKTHSPEFGSSPSSESALFGETHNPWDLAHSAGGSSGGSAAAVAAGIVPAAHASDGGGSIRIPASACGLFGMKPSRGRLPLGPAVYEGWGGLSTPHVISRSVRDSALLLDATQGAAPGDAYSSPAYAAPYQAEITRAPEKLRIALMPEPVLPVPVERVCVQAVEEAARLCEALGHEVEPAKPTLEFAKLWADYGLVTCVGIAQKVARREAALGRVAGPDELEAINRRNVETGRAADAVAYAEARDTLHAASRTLGVFMERYDMILSPTMAAAPAKLGALSLSQEYEPFVGPASAASAFTALFNITGQPAMSVPLHWSEAGLPIGVMFAARLGDEAALFRLGAQLEQAAPWFEKLPPL